MSDTEKFLGSLSAIGERMAEERKAYEAENDAWWNALSQREREDAFYAVVKRIYQGEIVEQGSYRYVLYDIFDFDASMYVRGMDCGYMSIHNAIKTDDEEQIIYKYYEAKNEEITRCSNKDEAGNCPLHNLHCTYPDCEKKGEEV